MMSKLLSGGGFGPTGRTDVAVTLCGRGVFPLAGFVYFSSILDDTRLQ